MENVATDTGQQTLNKRWKRRKTSMEKTDKRWKIRTKDGTDGETVEKTTSRVKDGKTMEKKSLGMPNCLNWCLTTLVTYNA